MSGCVCVLTWHVRPCVPLAPWRRADLQLSASQRQLPRVAPSATPALPQHGFRLPSKSLASTSPLPAARAAAVASLRRNSSASTGGGSGGGGASARRGLLTPGGFGAVDSSHPSTPVRAPGSPDSHVQPQPVHHPPLGIVEGVVRIVASGSSPTLGAQTLLHTRPGSSGGGGGGGGGGGAGGSPSATRGSFHFGSTAHGDRMNVYAGPNGKLIFGSTLSGLRPEVEAGGAGPRAAQGAAGKGAGRSAGPVNPRAISEALDRALASQRLYGSQVRVRQGRAGGRAKRL